MLNTEGGMGKPIFQGEPDLWLEPAIEQRAKQVAIDCLCRSYEHYRKFRANCDEYFDLYTNQPLKLRQTGRVRSNVPSGRVPEMIDTYIADLQSTIFSHRPVVGVTPERMEDLGKSEVLSQKLQYDMDNWTEDMGALPAVNTTLFQVSLWGASASKELWEERVKPHPFRGVLDPATMRPYPAMQKGFQGAILEPIFLYDAYPHPAKVWPDDPYPVVHLSYKSYDELYDLKGIVYNSNIDLIPDRKDIAAVLGDLGDLFLASMEDLYERSDQRARLGWTTDARLEPDGVQVLECECMFRPKIQYEDSNGRKHKGQMPIRTIITVANGIVIRISPSPLPEGLSIWQNAKMNHMPGQWYGMGLVQKNRPQVHVEDTILNMWLQNVAQTVNKPKIVNTTYLESGQSLDDQPGGVIRARGVADVSGVMREIQTTSVYNDVAGILRYIGERGQGVGGSNDLKEGRIPQGQSTATVGNLAAKQTAIRFNHSLAWIGATFILPQARKGYYYNREYLSRDFAGHILGQDGARQWFTIKTTDFINNVSFTFMGPSEMENEEMRVAQLLNFLKVLSPFNASKPDGSVSWAEQPVKEVIVLLAEKFHIPNLDKLKTQIGYGVTPPPVTPPPAPPTPGGPPAPGPGMGRVDRRLGSGGPPTNMTELAKSMGGLMSGAQNPGPR